MSDQTSARPGVARLKQIRRNERPSTILKKSLQGKNDSKRKIFAELKWGSA
jgi:hypothetical protein